MSQAAAEPCCTDWANCQRPCTPRGTHEATKRLEGFMVKAAMHLPAEFAKVVTDEFWHLLDGHPERTSAVSERAPRPVQVRLQEFLKFASKNPELIGIPVYWAEWPTQDQGASAGTAEPRKDGDLAEHSANTPPSAQSEAHPPVPPAMGTPRTPYMPRTEAEYWVEPHRGPVVYAWEMDKLERELAEANTRLEHLHSSYDVQADELSAANERLNAKVPSVDAIEAELVAPNGDDLYPPAICNMVTRPGDLARDLASERALRGRLEADRMNYTPERVAEAVAAERERCAKIKPQHFRTADLAPSPDWRGGYNLACEQYEAAIRDSSEGGGNG